MQAITLSTCMNPFCNAKFLNQERLGRNALAACYRDGIGFVPQRAVFVFAGGFTGAKFPGAGVVSLLNLCSLIVVSFG